MAGSHWPGCKHMGSKHRQVDVPQQPLASGSCAINAANIIERTINPAVERWTHPRPSYFRVRAMKLLTGYSTVRLAVELVTIVKQLLIFFSLQISSRTSFVPRRSITRMSEPIWTPRRTLLDRKR